MPGRTGWVAPRRCLAGVTPQERIADPEEPIAHPNPKTSFRLRAYRGKLGLQAGDAVFHLAMAGLNVRQLAAYGAHLVGQAVNRPQQPGQLLLALSTPADGRLVFAVC